MYSVHKVYSLDDDWGTSTHFTPVEYLFFVSGKARFFSRNLTLGYMTKTLNQIILFPPPKSEYFFQQHWESEYFFYLGT
jgi:hypothetical protein